MLKDGLGCSVSAAAGLSASLLPPFLLSPYRCIYIYESDS